ncbi:3'-5' exonuclease, partial [Oxalobacter sp. OttesenSCG-928-P03]|nr:3'-5' exonuclease [Oxalobacter sp. OttesenSCG-928-P03]
QPINPGRPIDAKAQAVHGITFEMLTKEPEWEVVAPKLQRVISASEIIVAHNGLGFDMPFVTHELKRAGLEVPEKKVVDTCVDGRWATPLGKIPNLRELCFACNVEYDPDSAHAAEYDVDVMMKCFFHGYKKGFFRV